MNTISPFICLGSLNAKDEDRKLNRNEIISCQLIREKNIIGVEGLSVFGKLGLSSWVETGNMLYFTTGNTFYKFNVDSDDIREISIRDLIDVHEMTFIDGNVWLANTGLNELICYNPHDEKIERRVRLKKRHDLKAENTIDSYHVNQCFKDLNGNLLSLVHHVSGQTETIPVKVKNRIKKQGDGGVICPYSNKVYVTGLKAPHSVRIINDYYVLCDSGNFQLIIYDDKWNIINKIKTFGWGRGLMVTNEHVFVGVSATRKRYLGILPDSQSIPNMVIVYNRNNFNLIDRIIIPNVEQINNIYPVPRFFENL